MLEVAQPSSGLDHSPVGEGLTRPVEELGGQYPERRCARCRRRQPRDRALRESDVVGQHQHVRRVVREQVLDADVHACAVTEVPTRVDGVDAGMRAPVLKV